MLIGRGWGYFIIINELQKEECTKFVCHACMLLLFCISLCIFIHDFAKDWLIDNEDNGMGISLLVGTYIIAIATFMISDSYMS